MATDKPASPLLPTNRRSRLTPGDHELAALGVRTKEVVEQLFGGDAGAGTSFHPLPKWDDGEWAGLATALAPPWTDEKTALCLTKLISRLGGGAGSHVDGQAIGRWVTSHPNEPDSVLDCALLVPPDGFTVLAAMSKTGSQTRVYHARWKQGQREVVLPRLLGTIPHQEVILERELQSHSLAMRHPNIITTYPLQNAKGDKFLVEQRLPVALDNRWAASGVHEAANLLHDIAQAPAYLHGELALAHGDIKPDNIRQKDGAYILLDFRICRHACDFTSEATATATGSLRTRAPELFAAGPYPKDARKFDVWAIGATVFRAVTRRFPSIDEEEPVPRVSNPAARAAFESRARTGSAASGTPASTSGPSPTPSAGS